MFYQMITKKRDKWLASPDCSVTSLINYIEATGYMRDAQLEAIKTYLFLKISCGNKPLWELFSSGAFNTLDLNEYELKPSVIDLFKTNPTALALFEYSIQKNSENEQVSAALEKLIRANETKIDYIKVIKDFFYNVSYTDYVYSLPMGAGKTYLMAAFIYLDLYFATTEPNNRAFAHNFIIFAPSGLKSSVIPSLKTIQKFEPSWIIPEPAATNLKRLIKFEILDQQKSASKSNKAKNPNAHKIANHQPFDELMGLVIITNAEKVILDYVKIESGQLSFIDNDDGKQANELREMLRKLPQLSVFIDEVHHAADDEIKLRAVINELNHVFSFENLDFSNLTFKTEPTVTNVIGFSGTPYLDSADPVVIGSLSLKNIELSNVVYYYSLSRGVGNFLKQPLVYISDNPNSMEIVANGVRQFLNLYKDKVYTGGLTAKLAIYCGQIASLEETFLPLVNEIAGEYGMNPNDVVLKYYGKDSKGRYICPPENAVEYAALDTPLSKKKIILLVQIGKEGWDCRSLTGVILSQKGDCPTNMVLQTSCRCLRQVEKGTIETAGIWLNEFNGETLEAQLKKQHHISIEEFMRKRVAARMEIERFDRMKYLKLPPVDFYQLKVQYDSINIEQRDTEREILTSPSGTVMIPFTKIKDFNGNLRDTRPDEVTLGEPVTYNQWLYQIVKESFGTLTFSELSKYNEALKTVFEQITVDDHGICRYEGGCDHATIRSRIRVAFATKTTLKTTEEVVDDKAALLRIENLISPILTATPDDYYPPQPLVKKVLAADKGKADIKPEIKTAIDALIASGNEAMAQTLMEQHTPLPERDKTYHYLPYHFDSGFEQRFFKELVTISEFKDRGLEVYYNGDRGLTDFKIRCFKGSKGNWRYIGKYAPDFLILNRKDGKIHKAIIVETKGEGYAGKEDFKDKRSFVETVFKDLNNEQFGYHRFDYLYLEDSLSDNERINRTVTAIQRFFGEDN